PSVVIFLAHWCPHCQEEVTEIVEFLEDGPFPAGVEVVSVSTLVDSGRDNYPPEAWLEAEGWPFPTLRDDADSTVAATYGLSGTPFSVFLDAEGRVVQRVSGVIPPAALAGLLEALAEGHSADDGPLLPAADDVRAAA
ncbi:MAG TPA: TlpA disulfide reductase family protein, partial [Acidimicrobiia bacterium]|nr:TlpA disulfide reductase family protein [Acidimicrobiia bacterium]